MQTDTSIIQLNTSLIIPNKYQPRKIFDEKSLDSLAESIKNYGIINPILVRRKDDKYEIIAGERRFRAAQKVGLTEVPVIIKNADEQQMAELALIENIQRQGLNPIEEAKSYEEILRIGNYTQQNLAIRLGKSQSAIANKIRLLSLPQEIQDALAEKKISERHARSLVSIETKEKQLELLNRIITEKLTVKETDQIINEKEITEQEIKQAISDIMKSLNIKEEEKEDDNMNNGNFFPNFDNNNVANQNASLNMMNMQSMNQPMYAPEPEMVMPTMAPVQEPQQPTMDMNPQMVIPEQPMMTPPMIDETLFSPTVQMNTEINSNNNMDFMGGFNTPQNNTNVPQMMEPTMINDNQLFGQDLMATPVEANPQMVTPEPPAASSMVDEPLFNPNITMPTIETSPAINQFAQPEQPMIEPEQSMLSSNPFEVPVTTQPEMPLPVATDKLTELQNLLNANGYTYKVYSNDTDNCVIIELPIN